jgi:hypothetical protein
LARILPEQMGDVWPSWLPGTEDADYGSATISPAGAFPVRSRVAFTITYIVGEYGLDDTGAIKIVQRWTPDGGPWQVSDLVAANYVTARASNGVDLVVSVEEHLHQRPWYFGVRITVRRGYMAPGDRIEVVLGDQSGGGPGYVLQTFPETDHEFRVLADPCSTGVFLPVAGLHVDVVSGPVVAWKLVAPTLRRPGEAFALGVRAEDEWGNATGDHDATLRIVADEPVDGLPESVVLAPGRATARLEGVSVPGEGVTRFRLLDDEGRELALSNPVVTRADGPRAFWGDLHGQSGETVGINPMREYLEYARDLAFLDVTSHQANDFQVTNAFWAEINDLSAEFDDPGRFTVFPGYEWSANTPLGGDHNVFFRHEGRQIHRSSHALLADRSDLATDAQTLEDLFAALADEDAVVYAHVGGRPADISRAHDARLRTAVEVHSDWGTFEWIMMDAFRLGYRVGLVCNSDGHKGAPGACYPGASEFGAYSGLTCFLTDHLSRDGIFGAMRARHHYGTTGCRMHLEVTADLGRDGRVWPEDPAVSDLSPVPAVRAVMGDIAAASGPSVSLRVAVNAQAPILRVEVMNGDRVVAVHRPYGTADLGQRVRVIWEGAEYRGRGRQTFWTGLIGVEGARISRMAKLNAWNLERRFRQVDAQNVEIDAVTTGNFGGCDLWLDGAAATVSVETPLARVAARLDELGLEDRIAEAGGLERRLRLIRLPERLETRDLEVEVPVALDRSGDNPIWVKITTEDGHNAWSSPIYLLKDEA